eukprot:1354664-Pleurochrysis_carterae.AAC.2
MTTSCPTARHVRESVTSSSVLKTIRNGCGVSVRRRRDDLRAPGCSTTTGWCALVRTWSCMHSCAWESAGNTSSSCRHRLDWIVQDFDRWLFIDDAAPIRFGTPIVTRALPSLEENSQSLAFHEFNWTWKSFASVR